MPPFDPNEPTLPTQPKMSVIVPSHNTRELTLRCFGALSSAVQALTENTRTPASTAPFIEPTVELVLVDDGSQDGTSAALQRAHPSVRILRNEAPTGFTAAANLGLQAATGEVLLLLNSDTEVDDQALVHLRAAFAAEPRLGVAGARLLHPDGRGQWSGGPEPTLAWAFAMSSGLPAALRRLPLYGRLRPERSSRRPSAGSLLRPVAWLPGAAVAIRRAVFAALGPLDPRFDLYAQDLDFCLQARAAGWQVAVVPAAVVMHVGAATTRQQAGATRGGYKPGALWIDLLRWAGKRGQSFQRRFARCLLWGGRWRRFCLGIALFFRRDEASRLLIKAELVAFGVACQLALSTIEHGLPLEPRRSAR